MNSYANILPKNLLLETILLLAKHHRMSRKNEHSAEGLMRDATALNTYELFYRSISEKGN